MTLSLWRSALVLGLLSLVGPFAIDMYLLAMPEIVADLGVDGTAIPMVAVISFCAVMSFALTLLVRARF